MVLEILSHGRQTVLPPSIHPDTGQPYEWIALPDLGAMAPSPLSRVIPPALTQATAEAIETRLEELGITKRRVERGQGLARALAEGERRRYEAFLAPKLHERLAAVQATAAGGRQDALNGACFALAPWVREGFVDEVELEAALRDACLANGYIREDGDKAFTRQFSKALEDGWNAELPDLDAGRAAQLMGPAPLPSGLHLVPRGAAGDGAGPDMAPSGQGGPVSGEIDLGPRLVGDLLTQAVPAREWTVKGWIPHKQMTLVYGDGGTGKTTLLMQLAMTAATGGRFFGHPVAARKVLFVSAEDELDELHYRFTEMSRLLGDSVPGLSVVSLANMDSAELMALDGTVLKATSTLEALSALVARERFDMLILDPLADMFGGNEIDKRQVTRFMRTLRKRFAFELGCTVVMAGHPSSDGQRRGTGESGSKAWSNSARSRCYLSRGEDGETLTLELMKANRAKLGDKIAMKWVEGVFVQVAAQAQSLISQHEQARIIARLDREGPIYQASNRSPEWVGIMIGLELGRDLQNPKGKNFVAQLLDSWEKLKIINYLATTNKQGNKRRYITVA